MPKVHNVIVLDESGSMSRLKKEARDGHNAVIKSLKKTKGKGTFTTILVGDRAQAKFVHRNLSSAEKLRSRDYNPSGLTALYDGIGLAIEKILPMKKKGDRVLVSIITDGMENNSKEWTAERLKKMISRLRDRGWEFTFQGTSEAATMSATSLGVPSGNVLIYQDTRTGTDRAFKLMSTATRNFMATTDGMETSNLYASIASDDDADPEPQGRPETSAYARS